MFGHFIYCFTVFYTHSTYFGVVVKTNTNNYAERWCAYIKAEYTSERRKEGTLFSCETSLHYVPLRTLMVLFDQNNFRLNKTGLHMVDTLSVHPNLTFVTSRVCLDVTMRALSREHGELLSDWLSIA